MIIATWKWRLELLDMIVNEMIYKTEIQTNPKILQQLFAV